MIGAPLLMVNFSRAFQFFPGTARAIVRSPKSQPAHNRVQNTGNTKCRNQPFFASPAPFSWSLALRLAKATATAARPCRPTRSVQPVVPLLAQLSPRRSTATSRPVPSSAQPVAHFATTPASASAATDKTSPVRGRALGAVARRNSENWKCPRNSSSFSASALPVLPAVPRASTRLTRTAPSSAQASVRLLPIWADTTCSKARPSAAQPVRCATTSVSASNDFRIAPTARLNALSPNEFRRPGLVPGRLSYVRPLPLRPLSLRNA